MDTTTAALQAGVTTATIRTWARRNVIAAAKVAGRWVIEAASLARRIALGGAKKPADLTEKFCDELTMQIYGAAEARSLAALQAMLRAARARDTRYLGGVPAAQVHLTDAQWGRVAKDISFEISCIGAEY